MEKPFRTLADLSTTEPTAADKACARALMERVFEQADRFGQEQGIDPDAADAAIDAAVQDVRDSAPGSLPK